MLGGIWPSGAKLGLTITLLAIGRLRKSVAKLQGIGKGRKTPRTHTHTVPLLTANCLHAHASYPTEKPRRKPKPRTPSQGYSVL